MLCRKVALEHEATARCRKGDVKEKDNKKAEKSRSIRERKKRKEKCENRGVRNIESSPVELA